MEELNGMDSSPPPSPTLSLWASRAECSTPTRTDWCQSGSVRGAKDFQIHTSSTALHLRSTGRWATLCLLQWERPSGCRSDKQWVQSGVELYKCFLNFELDSLYVTFIVVNWKCVKCLYLFNCIKYFLKSLQTYHCKFISEIRNYLKMSYNLTEGSLARICAQNDEVQDAVVQVLGHKAINVSNK